MTTCTPHPIADIICAWANGFRVEFRYWHHNPGNPQQILCSDERWHLCGKAYSAFSSINEHRIHPDDLDAWESFKRKPAEDAASGERARIVNYIRDLSRTPGPSTLAFRILADKIRDAQDIF